MTRMKSELPEGISSLTQAQMDQVDAWTKSYHEEPTTPTGTVVRCPFCKNNSLVYTNNLTRDIPLKTGVKTLTRLPGAECQNCHARAYSSGAQKIIMLEKSKSGRMPSFDGKVTNLSGKQAGLYLASNIQQLADLHAGSRVRITITDDGNLFVEVIRDEAEPSDEQ